MSMVVRKRVGGKGWGRKEDLTTETKGERKAVGELKHGERNDNRRRR